MKWMRMLALAAGAFCAAFVAATPPAAAQQRGGTMVIALSGEPSALVGFLHTDTGGHSIAANIFSGLVGLNEDFEPVPELARSWEISEDGLTYTFHLDPNARFHDGVPVTAEDVAFTFNDVVAKYHPSRGSWWPNVESATAEDEHTFVMKLKKPFPPLLTLLAYQLRSGAEILPKHIYEGSDPMTNPANEHPIGSGAFKFVEWSKGSHVVLERNDDYFMEGKPYLDRLIFQFIPDPNTRILAFERGEVDFIDYTAVPHNEVARLAKDPRFKLLTGADAIAVQGMWLLNVRKGPLAKKEVRQALSYAIDVNEISEKALFGAGRPAHSFLNSNLKWAFNGSYDVYDRDVEKANQLLDEAGYPRGENGTRFTINILWAAGRPYDGKSAEIIRDQLRDVGVTADVKTYDRPTFIEKVFDQWDFDTAMQLYSTGPDPAISVVTRYHTKQINHSPFTNAMGYSNPELDKIFDEDASEVSDEKRKENWDEAQKILMQDLPAIPVFEFPDGHLANARLMDAVTGPYGYFQSRHNAWFKD
ncbi:ABC transporter substrate-binding protein [Afifella sp. H1R]|uniref:ABC transporter substrate-binding protein n=1 Tax=Afifella sp. H1R TaxID=2908841 RepID=UPI001F1F6CDB|nr:ABC transporter substrate-binding protein [Afifella sp. H1R]MCF1502386.1 ABC transporter substrate-binding protein [Afifella sp. H1R]